MQNTYLSLIISGLSLPLILLNNQSKALGAGMVHDHCATQGYTSTIGTFENKSGTFDLDYFVDPTVTPPTFLPPPPPFKICKYEISDLTSLNITIDFPDGTNSGEWTLEIPKVTDDEVTRSFNDGQAELFQLAPHQNMSGDPMFEFNALDGNDDILTISFSDPNPANLQADQITITGSGTHYYLGTTPEPSALIGLLAVGGLGIASKLKKKSQ